MRTNVDDGFSQRLHAYANTGHDGALTVWTPEAVQDRLVEAFEVLARLPSRHGPARVKNAWPTTLIEFHELVDPQAYGNAMATKERERPMAPSSEEVSRAEESIAWCMQHLADSPIHSDALQTWACGTALGRGIAKIIRARASAARAKAATMTVSENARRDLVRKVIASNVHKWMSARIDVAQIEHLASPVTVESAKAFAGRVRNIEHNARLRAHREITEVNGWDVTYRMRDAMPGKVLSESTLERHRKVAASMLCAALIKKGVPVRERG